MGTRVIIPAAGTGTRLRPLTEQLPKALVSVCGVPLIWHTMKRLAEAGVPEVVVVCGHRAERLRSSLMRCPYAPPLRFVENSRFATTNSIVSLALTREFWSEPFCVIDGDVLVARTLLRRLLEAGKDVLAIDTTKKWTDIDMKVLVHEGRVVDFGKDLPPSPEFGEFFGVSRWSPEGACRLSSAVDELLDAGHIDQWYEAAIRILAAREGLDLLPASTAEWAEVDALPDLVAAVALVELDDTDKPTFRPNLRR